MNTLPEYFISVANMETGKCLGACLVEATSKQQALYIASSILPKELDLEIKIYDVKAKQPLEKDKFYTIEELLALGYEPYSTSEKPPQSGE